MEAKLNILTENSVNVQDSRRNNINHGNEVQPTSSMQHTLSYIWNDTYVKTCDKLPKVPFRASLVHSLIESYGLLEKARIINPRPARTEELELFHSADYLQFLTKISAEEDWEKLSDEADQYGLTYDCPPFPGVYEYAGYVAGASIKAAQCLMLGLSRVAVNWNGGWHHSKRDEASGFCFLNDIVVAILTLRRKYERVLYVDLDLHHGDGVEDAFSATSKVFTLSFHKVSPGFFPGTGDLSDVGVGRGKHYQLNVPLKDGVQDDVYIDVFSKVIAGVRAAYAPDAVVCQCGADGLHGDPMSSYNLTPRSLASCVRTLRDWGLPLLLLGGGGYNLPNTARCWAQITATVMGKTLPSDIPEHRFFTKYGPDYCLEIEPGNRKDLNTPEYIDGVLKTVKEHLVNLSPGS